MISLIVAMSRNRVIGRGNELPWSLPGDLKRFRSITLGKPVVMGRKTFESIGRPLPGRRNIVVSRNRQFGVPGIETVRSVDEAVRLADGAPELMVIGGEQIYRLALPTATCIYLTIIERDIDGDAYFPELDPSRWVQAHCAGGVLDERNALAHRFVTLVRSR